MKSMKNVGVAWLLASAVSAMAQTAPASAASAATPLAEPKARITDEAIHEDRMTYEAAQSRIQALNERGRPLADYHLAKAQCWLDVSRHEYSRNDRSAFPQGALDESAKLIDAMEKGTAPLPMDTPFIDGATELRPDLWKQSKDLKARPGFRCAQQKLACGEVQLVLAGHEAAQIGWRHASPYVQMAETLLAEAKEAAGACKASAKQ